MNKCSRCRSVHFCDEECFRAGWKTHKKECKALAAAAATKKGGGGGGATTQVSAHASEGKDPDGPATGDAKDSSKDAGGAGEGGGGNRSDETAEKKSGTDNDGGAGR